MNAAASPSVAAPAPAPSAAAPPPAATPPSAPAPSAPAPADLPGAAAQRAVLRLGVSRLRLACALAAWRADPAGDDDADDADDGGRVTDAAGRGIGTRLFDALIDAVGLRGHAPLAWLAWRVSRTLGRNRLGTWATRHPWRLVGAAALGGALLIGARPWRLLTRPAVLVGLLMQLVGATGRSRPAAPLPAQPAGRGRHGRRPTRSTRSRPERRLTKT